NNLAADLTTTFGPDNQPYFGGQKVINTFNSVPGSSDLFDVTTAWPNCIWQNTGAGSLAEAFADPDSFRYGCASAQPNLAFASALLIQPNTLISHGKYMYTGPIGGTVYQFLVKVNPFSGLSEYKFRTFVTGLPIVTGLGVDDALQSLFVYSDPTAVGLAGREFVTKLPLCEDMDGEVPQGNGAVAGGTPSGGSTGGTGGTTAGGTTSGGTTAGGTTSGGTTAGGTTAGGTAAGAGTGGTTATASNT